MDVGRGVPPPMSSVISCISVTSRGIGEKALTNFSLCCLALKAIMKNFEYKNKNPSSFEYSARVLEVTAELGLIVQVCQRIYIGFCAVVH